MSGPPDVTTAGAGTPAAPQAARMSPLSRYLNVFFSPGAVFDDIRRDPRGWWVPILIGCVVAAIFAAAYFQRFGPLQGEIEAAAIRNSDAMKAFMPPEKIDESVQQTLKLAEGVPTWQRQVQRIALLPAGSLFFTWLLTAFFTIVALAMGWLKELRGWRFVVHIAIGIVGFFLTGMSEVVPRIAMSAKAARQDYSPTSSGVVALGAVLSLIGAALLAWILIRTAREASLGPLVGSIPYALAPLAVGGVVGIVIALVKAPDPTSMEELVPSNLGALLGMKGGALGSLAGSLDIFVIWMMVLLTFALARAFGRRPGAVAPAVFVPWLIWVLGKAGIAAVFAMGS